MLHRCTLHACFARVFSGHANFVFININISLHRMDDGGSGGVDI
jgi:hypothetical protein